MTPKSDKRMLKNWTRKKKSFTLQISNNDAVPNIQILSLGAPHSLIFTRHNHPLTFWNLHSPWGSCPPLPVLTSRGTSCARHQSLCPSPRSPGRRRLATQRPRFVTRRHTAPLPTRQYHPIFQPNTLVYGLNTWGAVWYPPAVKKGRVSFALHDCGHFEFARGDDFALRVACILHGWSTGMLLYSQAVGMQRFYSMMCFEWISPEPKDHLYFSYFFFPGAVTFKQIKLCKWRLCFSLSLYAPFAKSFPSVYGHLWMKANWDKIFILDNQILQRMIFLPFCNVLRIHLFFFDVAIIAL